MLMLANGLNRWTHGDDDRAVLGLPARREPSALMAWMTWHHLPGKLGGGTLRLLGQITHAERTARRGPLTSVLRALSVESRLHGPS